MNLRLKEKSWLKNHGNYGKSPDNSGKRNEAFCRSTLLRATADILEAFEAAYSARGQFFR
jgi:hypothetical protein